MILNISGRKCRPEIIKNITCESLYYLDRCWIGLINWCNNHHWFFFPFKDNRSDWDSLGLLQSRSNSRILGFRLLCYGGSMLRSRSWKGAETCPDCGWIICHTISFEVNWEQTRQPSCGKLPHTHLIIENVQSFQFSITLSRIFSVVSEVVSSNERLERSVSLVLVRPQQNSGLHSFTTEINGSESSCYLASSSLALIFIYGKD